MTSAILSDLEKAAIPSAIAVLQAVKVFATNIGNDPTKWALTVTPALAVLIATAQLQVPSLLVGEGAAAVSVVNAQVDALIAKLTAAQAAQAAK